MLFNYENKHKDTWLCLSANWLDSQENKTEFYFYVLEKFIL
jgi:hypothetical protein